MKTLLLPTLGEMSKDKHAFNKLSYSLYLYPVLVFLHNIYGTCMHSKRSVQREGEFTTMRNESLCEVRTPKLVNNSASD